LQQEEISLIGEKYGLNQNQTAFYEVPEMARLMGNNTVRDHAEKANRCLLTFLRVCVFKSFKMSPDWVEAYEPLRDFQYIAGLLLVSLIPFAVQVAC